MYLYHNHNKLSTFRLLANQPIYSITLQNISPTSLQDMPLIKHEHSSIHNKNIKSSIKLEIQLPFILFLFIIDRYVCSYITQHIYLNPNIFLMKCIQIT